MKEYKGFSNQLVMTRKQVRSFDAWAINELGIPGVVLMENAGRSCAELIKEKLSGIAKPKVCIFCGTGNNGGDGFVIARHLKNSGFEVAVVICGDRNKIKGDAKINLDILENLGQQIIEPDLNRSDLLQQIKELAAGADMLVDGIFGTGLEGLVSENYQRLIRIVNSLGIPILAIDIPSGLDCDSGKPLGEAIRANFTVTFVAMKKGFTAGKEVSAYTGDIFIASTGVEPGYKLAN